MTTQTAHTEQTITRDGTFSSDGELSRLWHHLLKNYFPHRVDLCNYDVKWSKRDQKRVLASCNMTHRRIRVARAMDDSRWSHHLSALLFHELCHAVLGETGSEISGAHRWHGKEFRGLEAKHEGIAALELWIKEGGWKTAVRSYSRKKSVVV